MMDGAVVRDAEAVQGSILHREKLRTGAIAMSARVFLLATAGLLVYAGFGPPAAGAGELPAESAPSRFGADTPGGRGGAILRVTNLDADGPGSLRAAIQTKGRRIVVFEIAGVIDLGGKALRIDEPYLTVAGQTAPSPGITVIRGAIYITAHDVILRHLRVRPGDDGRPKRSGWEPDGISTSGGNAHDVLIDHCSVTWATDENVSVSGPRLEGPEATSHRVTIRNCIIAECLHDSTHAKGPHSMGSLIHDFCREVAVVGNLYAHNNARNPYFKAHTTGAIVNNVIYNPGSAAIQLGYSAGEWVGSRYEPVPPRVSVVGNVYLQGANTRAGLAMIERPGKVFEADNIALDRDGKPATIVGRGVEVISEKPAWPEGLEPLPARDVLDAVIRRAGARPRDRDEIDKRIIRELVERKGQIIHSQEEVGGYPRVEPVRRPLDVPGNAKEIDAWLDRLAAELE
jgi:hypothetical protein